MDLVTTEDLAGATDFATLQANVKARVKREQDEAAEEAEAQAALHAPGYLANQPVIRNPFESKGAQGEFKRPMGGHEAKMMARIAELEAALAEAKGTK